MSKIIKNINILKQVSEPVNYVSEALDIIKKLKSEISKSNNGIGLAAIQIGIKKKVAVLKNNDDFIYMINSDIIEKKEQFIFFSEGCLSFPGEFYNTNRYRHFTIRNNIINDNKFEEQTLYFYYPPSTEDYYHTKDYKFIPVAIQHEMDHFSGKIITEYAIKNTPIKKDSLKIGRNASCPCGSGMKFKKCCIK